MRERGAAPLHAIVGLVTAIAVIVGCNRQTDEGARNLVQTVPTGGFSLPQGPRIGYVDINKVVAAHPLNSELVALQDQITALNARSLVAPKAQTAEQKRAQAQLEADLADQDKRLQSELDAKRSYYLEKERQAIGQLQGAAFAPSGGANPLLDSLRKQFGEEMKKINEAAGKTLSEYRDQLFKADREHLRQVQGDISADVGRKLAERQRQLSDTEDKYQHEVLVKDQDQKVNLKAQLENLQLSDAQRAQLQSQLQNLEARETYLINQQKARDNADLDAYKKQLQSQAIARFDAERSKTQEATNAKLLARQKDVQGQVQTQMKSLTDKFNAQLQGSSTALRVTPDVQKKMEAVHGQMQGQYQAAASTALAAYRQTRKYLVNKYSLLAHMQFQDNEAIAQEIDSLATQRRDLYAKIVEQVRGQVQVIARKDGIDIVFSSIAGNGSAVDLTADVAKAIASLPASPSSAPSGGRT